MSRYVYLVLSGVIWLSACSYQGAHPWRRSTCESIVDRDERARCLEEATQSEAEYRRDVEEALAN